MTASSGGNRQRLGIRPRLQPDDRRADLRGRREGAGRHRKQELRSRPPLREHGKPPVGLRAWRGDDAVGHLALEHERQALPVRRPGLGREPADEERRRDVVGKVRDDAERPAGGERRKVEVERIALDDRQPAGSGGGDLLQRRQRAGIALDRGDVLGALEEQRARQAARPWSRPRRRGSRRAARRRARCGASD